MSDIVKRLRARSAKAPEDLWSDESDDELHDCAADEIERLRALIVEHQEAALAYLDASRRYRDAKALRYAAPHIVARCVDANDALENEARQHSSVVDEHLRSLGQ